MNNIRLSRSKPAAAAKPDRDLVWFGIVSPHGSGNVRAGLEPPPIAPGVRIVDLRTMGKDAPRLKRAMRAVMAKYGVGMATEGFGISDVEWFCYAPHASVPEFETYWPYPGANWTF